MSTEDASAIRPDPLLQRYQTLLDASDVIHGSRDLEELFRKLSGVLRRVVAYDAIAIGLVEPDGENIRLALLETLHEQPVKVGLVVPLKEVPAGWLVEHRKPTRVLIDTKSSEYAVHHFNMDRAGLRVSFHLPLTTPTACLGELIFSFRKVVDLPETELQFMQRVADQVALAIENANNSAESGRAQRDLENRNRQREQLLNLTNKTVSELNLQEVLRIAAQGVRQIVPCVLCAVALPEPDGKHLRLTTLEFPNGKGLLQEGLLMPIEASNVGRAFQAQEVLVLDGPAVSSYSSEMYRIVTGEGLRAQVFVPLLSRGRSLGVLGMSRTDDSVFAAEEVAYLKHVAAQISIAIENALQFEQLSAAEREVARERDRTQLLLEVNNAVVSHLDMHALVESISQSLLRLIPHDAAAFTLYDERNGMIQGIALHKQFPEDKGVFREGDWIPVEGTPEGEALAMRKRVLVREADLERFHSPLVKKARAAGIRSGCAVPLVSHDRRIGVLSILCMKKDAITEADAVLIGTDSSKPGDADSPILVRFDPPTRKITKLHSSRHIHAWAISPDRKQIAVASTSPDQAEGVGMSNLLLIIPSKGGEARELLRLPNDREFKALVWTPDGNSLLFQEGGEDVSSWGPVMRISLAGGQPSPLKLANLRLRGFRFHPDGRHLAYTVDKEQDSEVWVLENFLPQQKAAR